MGENDIDKLQSFGAKLTQKNQSVPKKNGVRLTKKVNRKRFNVYVKERYVRVQKRIKHFKRKIIIRSKASISPYLIKIQTFSKKQKVKTQLIRIKRRQLVERRKRIGNTIIVIRRWKKVSLPVEHNFPDHFKHVYYFHKNTQKKNKFQPKSSIWDVPIINDKK